MKTVVTLLFLLISSLSISQGVTNTVYDRTSSGERRLHLSGTFVGSDTAYIQIYHEGIEVTSDIAIMTFTLSLGEYTTYLVKFTDTKKRVKTISIHELGDGLIEFYPPFEIDFNRVGNLLLIKSSAKKPHYVEYDVGMGRSKVGRNDE